MAVIKDGKFYYYDFVFEGKDTGAHAKLSTASLPNKTKIGEWFLKNGESSGDFATGITKKR